MIYLKKIHLADPRQSSFFGVPPGALEMDLIYDTLTDLPAPAEKTNILIWEG